MAAADIVILCLYGLVLIAVSAWSLRFRAGGSEFTLGGRSFGIWPVLFSALATETSGASLLVFPDLGFAPGSRFLFLQVVLGLLTGRLIVAFVLVGPLYRSGCDSIYHFFSERSGKLLSRFLAWMYTVATVMAAGIRLMIAALALSALYGHADNTGYVSLFLVVTGVLAIGYSVAGGLRAVIWTDNIQFLLIAGGCLFLIYQSAGSGTLPSISSADFIRLVPDKGWLHSNNFFPTALIGGIVLSLGSHGADQTLLQRVLACRSEKEAVRVMVISALAILPLMGLFLFTGYAISSVPDFHVPRYVIPSFTAAKLGSPATGFLAVVFLAAAMSSIDSCLHSMGTSLAAASGRDSSGRWARNYSLASGVVLILSAFVFYRLHLSSPESPLINLALSATAVVFSPMVALFFPACLGRSPGQNRALAAVAAGFFCGMGIFLYNFLFRAAGSPQISWLLSAVFSFLVSLILIVTEKPGEPG